MNALSDLHNSNNAQARLFFNILTLTPDMINLIMVALFCLKSGVSL